MTVVKYLQLTTVEVEKVIKSKLPDKFALMFDAWTHNSYHLVGTFASFQKGEDRELLIDHDEH